MASHRGQVRRAVGALCAIALVAAVAAVGGGTASATTKPGSVFTLRVVITDSKTRLVPHRTASGQVLATYIHKNGLSATFPRGTLIQFLFTNEGTKTYLPAIRITDKSQADPYAHVKNLYVASKAIAPGGHVSLFGNFYFRGSFLIEKLFHKKALGSPVNVSIY